MSSQPAYRRAARSRRGATLLMFAMLVFVFMAVAGLAIDIGMAGLTQNTMQVAVDTAALEGMRLRDYDVYQNVSDQNRRPKVSQMVRLVLDDDLHPTGNSSVANDPLDPPSGFDGPDELHMGAGATMQVAGEIGSQEIIYSPSTPVWDDPVLRTNLKPHDENKQHGDMVSGLYRADQPHVELPGYVRPDFTAGNLTDEQYQSLAFLVRMRRTTGLNPLDKEPLVSSRGRPIPFLFGLGSLIRGGGGGYDPRREGMTIRATAIAVARPALRASPPPRSLEGVHFQSEGTQGQESNPILGLYPFALKLEFWQACVNQSYWVDDVFHAETWHSNYSLVTGPDGQHLVDENTGAEVGSWAEFGTCVGQELQPSGLTPISFEHQKNGYVAIYDTIPGPDGAVPRIVGYGFCGARNPQGDPKKITFSSGIQSGILAETSPTKVWVAANGVSARLDSTAPALTKEEWEAVFARNRFMAYGPCSQNPTGQVTYDYHNIRWGTLLAATLAR